MGQTTEQIGDKATQDLAELSMCALNLLTERMMYDLQHPVAIISSVGSKAWEADERGQAIATTLASHRQITSNKRKWLSTSHYFPKVLRSCFNLTLQSYFESSYCNTMAQGISYPSMVPLNLVILFNGSLFENYQGKSGFYSSGEVNRRLQVIQCRSRLLNPTVPPSELEDDTVRLLIHTSRNSDRNTAAILHTAGLRIGHCNEKVDRMAENDCTRRKVYKGRKRTQQRHSIVIAKLPDLRNSPYIRKMRVQRRTRQLKFSICQNRHHRVQKHAVSEMLL
jgi:hypothetical protein